MRVIVFFDLPVGTKSERGAATRFRNYLLSEGYYMIQFSVYGRLCNGPDASEKHEKRLLDNVPKEGSVRVLTVTEKQYAAMKILAGTKKEREKPQSSYQLSFF